MFAGFYYNCIWLFVKMSKALRHESEYYLYIAGFILTLYLFWLNAKPCGILDSAHMTHGLNP